MNRKTYVWAALAVLALIAAFLLWPRDDDALPGVTYRPVHVNAGEMLHLAQVLSSDALEGRAADPAIRSWAKPRSVPLIVMADGKFSIHAGLVALMQLSRCPGCIGCCRASCLMPPPLPPGWRRCTASEASSLAAFTAPSRHPLIAGWL